MDNMHRDNDRRGHHVPAGPADTAHTPGTVQARARQEASQEDRDIPAAGNIPAQLP